MKPKKRQKLCQNCEADVDLDVIVCPYCAADLREEKPEQGNLYVQQPLFHPEKTADSLYPPTYPKEEEELALKPPSEQAEEVRQGIILPTVFITLGSQLLLFGLLILLFSQNGTLLLRWEAKFWFFYVLASFPLLFLGYKSLSKLK